MDSLTMNTNTKDAGDGKAARINARYVPQEMIKKPARTWWGPLIVVVILFLVAGGIGSTISALLFGLVTGQGFSFDTTTAAGGLGMMFGFLFPLCGLLLWNSKRDKRSVGALGMYRTGAVYKYIAGFLAGGVFLALCVGVAMAFGGFQFTMAGSVNWLYVFLAAVGFGVQGFTEEVLCRGYVQGSVTAKYGPVWGVAESAILFACLHGANPGMRLLPFINLLLFGLVFSMVYMATDNLWFTGAAHSAWNFCLGVIFGINVSGNPFFVRIMDAKTVGSHLVHGGKFGLEGSLVTTAAGCLLLVALIVYVARFKKN